MLHRSTGDSSEPPPVLLRWAGGKQRLIPRLQHFLPRDYDERRYREPFLGAASLFLSMSPRRAVLSDSNRHLMHYYSAVRDSVNQVSRVLATLASEDSEQTYYAVREQYVNSRPSAAQAARFLYLNRTCFNGIFLVNKLGEFNVPYGYRDNPIFPSKPHLQRVSSVLSKVSLKTWDYQLALTKAQDGDFIYLDPPYPPLNGTSFFAHYTAERFSHEDQEKLSERVAGLHERGCLFMMSNADTPRIRRLYRGFHIHRLPVTRYVTSKSMKHQVGELVVTNYEVKS